MLHKLFDALARTRSSLAEAFQGLVREGGSDESLETLEEQLLMADMGVDMVESTLEVIRKQGSSDFMAAVEDHLIRMLPVKLESEPIRNPIAVLMVGVNGTGKTTTAA